MSTLSKITGGDASHHAGQLANQAQQQQTNANQYSSGAAGIYGNLNTQGQAQTNVFNQDYLPLLSKYGSFAGLGGNVLNPAGGAAPGQAGNTRTAFPGGPQAPATSPYPGSSFPNGGGPQQQDTNNPYSLDQNQQAQLNQSMQAVAQAKQQSLASTTQTLAQQGITGGPALAAAQQVINNHYDDLSSRTQVGFYEQIKQDKTQALQQIIGAIQGYGQQGLQTQEAAGSGFVGLASAAQGAQGSLAQQSLQQQNLSNEQLSGLTQLLGFGFGGGFGGAGKTASAASGGAGISATASAGNAVNNANSVDYGSLIGSGLLGGF